jgi:hypothetical protein
MSKTMAEVIEVVAAAMWEARPMERTEDGSPLPFRDAKDYLRVRYSAQAKVAIDALTAAGFGLVADATNRVGKRYSHLHQLLRDELQADAWDEGQKSGMRHADRVIAAHKIGRPELPGQPSPNPYRRPGMIQISGTPCDTGTPEEPCKGCPDCMGQVQRHCLKKGMYDEQCILNAEHAGPHK